MKNEEERDEDSKEKKEEEKEKNQPFNFLNFLQDPSKLLNSPQFKKMFEGIFKNLMENLDMDNPPKNFQNLSQEDLQEFMKNLSQSGLKGGPFMAGINIGFDSEGNPVMNSFNKPASDLKTEKKEEKEVREPLVDINEEEDEIIVIAELPGTEKENIELNATYYTLTISTKDKTNAGYKFYTEVNLPSAVNSDYAKARYTNGILEVKLKKIKSGKQSNIKIE
ncbi:MAG: Hsp20/alpha crystallin family protein [Promethearchaeota archaeon]|nr:MAG: Hsp20/alpha crystallin family protein [Candidatus Lokiarchaeota archaeon]